MKKGLIVGDRVVNTEDSCFAKKGDIGTVISLDSPNGDIAVTIEYDRNIGGHNCDGIGKDNFCEWTLIRKLKLVKQPKFSLKRLLSKFKRS